MHLQVGGSKMPRIPEFRRKIFASSAVGTPGLNLGIGNSVRQIGAEASRTASVIMNSANQTVSDTNALAGSINRNANVEGQVFRNVSNDLIRISQEMDRQRALKKEKDGLLKKARTATLDLDYMIDLDDMIREQKNNSASDPKSISKSVLEQGRNLINSRANQINDVSTRNDFIKHSTSILKSRMNSLPKWIDDTQISNATNDFEEQQKKLTVLASKAQNFSELNENLNSLVLANDQYTPLLGKKVSEKTEETIQGMISNYIHFNVQRGTNVFNVRKELNDGFFDNAIDGKTKSEFLRITNKAIESLDSNTMHNSLVDFFDKAPELFESGLDGEISANMVDVSINDISNNIDLLKDRAKEYIGTEKEKEFKTAINILEDQQYTLKSFKEKIVSIKKPVFTDDYAQIGQISDLITAIHRQPQGEGLDAIKKYKQATDIISKITERLNDGTLTNKSARRLMSFATEMRETKEGLLDDLASEEETLFRFLGNPKEVVGVLNDYISEIFKNRDIDLDDEENLLLFNKIKGQSILMLAERFELNEQADIPISRAENKKIVNTVKKNVLNLIDPNRDIYNEGDIIDTPLGSRKVVGFRNGQPLIEIPPEVEQLLGN